MLGHGFAFGKYLVHLFDHIRAFFAEVHVNGHHVIDGQHLQTLAPRLRR